jgi:hypothetical protein
VRGCAAHSYIFLCSLANALARETEKRFWGCEGENICRSSADVPRRSCVRPPAFALASLGHHGLARRRPTIPIKSLDWARRDGSRPSRSVAASPHWPSTRANDPAALRLALGQISTAPPSARALTNAEADKGAIDCLRLRRKLL